MHTLFETWNLKQMVERLIHVQILQLAVMYILHFHVTTSVGYTDNVTQYMPQDVEYNLG